MSKAYNWGIMATGKIAYTFAKAVNSVPDAEAVCLRFED